MFDVLTQAALVSVSAGGSIARVLGHRTYEPLHLLAGLLATEISDMELYDQYGISAKVVQKTLIEIYGESQPHWELKLPFSDSSKRVFELCKKELADKSAPLETRGHLIIALSLLTATDLGLTIEFTLKSLVRANLRYLQSFKDDTEYNSGVLSLSKNELLQHAVKCSQSEPNWRSILISDLVSKGLSIADVEQAAS